jgi:hypothetical protein
LKPGHGGWTGRQLLLSIVPVGGGGWTMLLAAAWLFNGALLRIFVAFFAPGFFAAFFFAAFFFVAFPVVLFFVVFFFAIAAPLLCDVLPPTT